MTPTTMPIPQRYIGALDGSGSRYSVYQAITVRLPPPCSPFEPSQVIILKGKNFPTSNCTSLPAFLVCKGRCSTIRYWPLSKTPCARRPPAFSPGWKLFEPVVCTSTAFSGLSLRQYHRSVGRLLSPIRKYGRSKPCKGCAGNCSATAAATDAVVSLPPFLHSVLSSHTMRYACIY